MIGPDSHLTEITRVIQLAVAPVFLLNAVAAIINVLATRLARIIDRARRLEEHAPAEFEKRQAGGESRNEGATSHVGWELGVLDRRMRLTYLAIGLSVVAALCVGLLIATAFVDAFLTVDLTRLVAILFIAAMAAFIASLLVFLREIFFAVASARTPLAARERSSG